MDDMKRLRNTIGILGMLLPALSLFFILAFGRDVYFPDVLDSISATHYSNAYLLFEGLVFGTGLFLLHYRGYDIADRALSVIAGIGALTLALFPVSMGGAGHRNFLMMEPGLANVIHGIGAFAFFAALFAIITFQFPKTNKPRNEVKGTPKARRNLLYKSAGAAMAVFLILGFGMARWTSIPYTIFIGEGLALWAFGIAWLAKGGLLLKDRS